MKFIIDNNNNGKRTANNNGIFSVVPMTLKKLDI